MNTLIKGGWMLSEVPPETTQTAVTEGWDKFCIETINLIFMIYFPSTFFTSI